MAVERDATDLAVGFARTLRAAGVRATPDRVHRFVEALSVLDPARRGDVYWAGRVTLCRDPDDVERYERVFAAYFGGVGARPVHRPRRGTAVLRPLQAADGGEAAGEQRGDDALAVRAGASEVEVLRHADLAALTRQQRHELARLLTLLALRGEARRSSRRRPARRGAVDRQRTVRGLLASGGEPARLRWAAPAERPRRVVLLVDVSGSMRSYSEALLRFCHAVRRRGPATEVFTLGTRLTRVTRELSHLDPDTAMAAAGAAIPDYAGGTRLGALLKEFLDRWGQRGLARGAVVVVLSDGWERGDARLLGEQMARLSRLAHRVVWANPLKARPGYAPLTAGMIAALPHVDDFAEGHSLAALERLARIVRGSG